MRGVIRWAIGNSPAMNTLMLGTILVGCLSLWFMRREVFPEFDLEIILITVPYPGASPEEVEEGICQKVEEAVRAVDGIRKRFSVAQEGAGNVILELHADVPNVQKILNEVESEVNRIPSFPELAEEPDIKQLTLRESAILVGILGPDSDSPETELQLRAVAERVRNELLLLPTVSQANIVGSKAYQIDIEIPEETLRKHGLSLADVARIVRRQNVELPGGTMRTDSQEILLRGKNKELFGERIADIPLVTQTNGVKLTVSDLGLVRDEFVDAPSINRINGQPGVVISVDRTKKEDLLAMVADVREYIADKELAGGYELIAWADRSTDVRDRMELLLRNGVQGLMLVFLVLAVFLNLRLAMWVALGIPIAILGASAVMLFADQTLNMLTMFAFLMALGIVVDDAIVIGENIFSHRQQGKPFLQAAVDGTLEVLPAVTASVCTTIIAFVPLMYVAGVMGKFIAVMPVVVIAMLVISLIESLFILPCHLAHPHNLLFKIISFLLYPFRPFARLFAWLNYQSSRGMEWLIERTYLPALRYSITHKLIVVCAGVALLLASFGFVRGGWVPYIVFPKLDSNWISSRVTFPDGTPVNVADAATQRIEDAINEVNARYAETDGPILKVVHRAVGSMTGSGALGPNTRTDGSHVGHVSVELVPVAERSVKSEKIIDEWRAATGEFSGAESLTFGTDMFGPGGQPIEFKLLADKEDMDQLEAAVEESTDKLRDYQGVFDIFDDSRPGKWEFQIKVKDRAKALGIANADLAAAVRGAYYGEEVMRLQRGRHEVKLMVRYPREDRRSLAEFDDIRVTSEEGLKVPMKELAEVNVRRGYSEINRLDQLRSITVTADIDETKGNAKEIVADLQASYMPELMEKYPGVSVRWEGQQEQTNESVRSMLIGFVVALLGMFVLLTIEFRSFFQPLLVLFIIPFGAIGAILGHYLLGLPLTIFSLFGLVALTGVVVNDSIVLIDFINKELAAGASLNEALLEAGRRRFRPVLLTSMTTVAGLTPILLETSFQAQILIPMAAALCFGLMAATGLILILVPTFYGVYGQFVFPASPTPDLPPIMLPPEDEAMDVEVVAPVDGVVVGQPVAVSPR